MPQAPCQIFQKILISRGQFYNQNIRDWGIKRDLTISTIAGQVPKDTLRPSPLLGDLMFLFSTEDLESLKKRRNGHYIFQILKQAAQRIKAASGIKDS